MQDLQHWLEICMHYMVLTTHQVFIIWNDFIRLHTFKNGKRSQNVDRHMLQNANLLYRVSQKTNWTLFDFMQYKSDIAVKFRSLHSEIINLDVDI